MVSKLQLNEQLIALPQNCKWVRCKKCNELFVTRTDCDLILCKDCGKLNKFKSTEKKGSETR